MEVQEQESSSITVGVSQLHELGPVLVLAKNTGGTSYSLQLLPACGIHVTANSPSHN